MRIIRSAIALLAWFFVSLSAYSAALPGIPEFIDEMVAKHQFKRAELENVFARAQHRPEVIEAISRPATTRPWLEYRAAFVNPKRIRLGLEFWGKHRHTLRRAERKYGVPQGIIVAVIGVETIYGQNAGNFRVLDALTTLAFDYPRRADFFRGELENYLLLAREQQFDLLDIRGSYAGALGIPQFMPSSYRNYAVDFNGNHKIDLLREDRDAIGSVANYLQGYGWIKGEPVAVRAQVGEEICLGEIKTPRSLVAWTAAGVTPSVDFAPDKAARLIDFTLEEGKEFWLAFNNFEVITRYNNSDYYAMSVFQLAEELKAARKAGLPK
ncbi:MAG: lytic murein transglycosylase B [Gallionella sp.]|nr:lytic murein transglycosylase B [Gallionella sp.]